MWSSIATAMIRSDYDILYSFGLEGIIHAASQEDTARHGRADMLIE